MKFFFRASCFTILSLITTVIYAQDNGPTFDRQAFYKAMQFDMMALVNEELNKLKVLAMSGKEAYEGAMTMKKASLAGGPDKKLSLFKSGRKKLEEAIQKDSSNIEFRFLRLIIEENAPKVLGYKNDLKKDSEYIRKSYKTLPKSVQQVIEGYSKKSKVLKIQDS